MNKLRSLLMAVGAALAFGVAWGETWTDDNDRTWTFTTNATSATLTGIDTEHLRGVIVIPETLAGKPVVAFGKVFSGQQNVTRVTIPSGVTAIADQAFLNCKNLKGVTINATAMTSIGYQAFRGCYNMESFVIPNSVTKLGQGVFSGCSALEEVTIGGGVTALPGPRFTTSSAYSSGEYLDSMSGYSYDGMFYDCTSLKTVNWGTGLKTIGNVAFLGCTALEKVEIPDTVTSIGYHAFYKCDNLGEVKIGGKVATVGYRAFFADGNLTKVTFGPSVTDIQQQAFQDCVNLQNFTLPASVQYLRYRCFAGCNKALTEVTIPTNKDELETELGQGVFSGCSKLTTVTLGDTVKTLPGPRFTTSSAYSSGEYRDSMSGYSYDGLFYDCTSLKTINWGTGLKTIGNVAFLGCTALEKVEIPDTVTSIGYHAFYKCDNLGEVKIGGKVATVGYRAFFADGNLTKVTFGPSVTDIQQQAFQDCVNLQNFTLPASVQYLRYRCFAGCNKALTEVTIPTNKDELETELGQGVFSGCSKLTTVTLGDTVKTLPGPRFTTSSAYSSGEYMDSMSGYSYDGMFYDCTSLKTVNWGTGLKTIGNVAFLGCTALEKVEIPDTVTSIGYHAFYKCDNLGEVKIGGKVATVGYRAFFADGNLTKVTFGPSVTDIQQQAFQDCVNLQNFTLPASVQYLRYRCFAGCNKALTEVTIPTNKDELETELGQGVFSGCSKLTTVTLGDTVKTLPGPRFTTSSAYSSGEYRDSMSGYSYDGLFYNCTSLKTINWGTGLKTIGNVAFLGCSALDRVTLPENVHSIGCHAFYNCTSLKNVTVAGSINYIGRRAFGNCPYLHYVDFQGESMAYNPGAEIFAFDKDRVTVYAAPDSTGWTGVADVGGLPASGKWSGATIVYEPVDPMMDNPYDFYPHTPTFRVSSRDKTWKAPMIVTGSPYLTTQTDPTALTNEIYLDDPIYLSYCVNEYWRGESAENLTNLFALTSGGQSLGMWEPGTSFDKTCGTNGRVTTNDVIEAMQGLPIGDYELTMLVNPARNLAETDYSNNETSITFKVVKRPPVKVTFNRNGGSGGTTSLSAVEYLMPMPAVEVPTKSGSVFFGYWTDASWSGAGVQYYAADGSGVRNSDLKSATTLYARWVKTNEVVFLANGGTGDMPALQVKSGVVYKLPPCAFTPPEGKTFAGWACSNGRRYDDEVLVFGLGGVTMTAIWE